MSAAKVRRSIPPAVSDAKNGRPDGAANTVHFGAKNAPKDTYRAIETETA